MEKTLNRSVTNEVPASILKLHPAATVYVDQPAAEKNISQICHPRGKKVICSPVVQVTTPAELPTARSHLGCYKEDESFMKMVEGALRSEFTSTS